VRATQSAEIMSAMKEEEKRREKKNKKKLGGCR
jgi:hypothetical protein